jgi:hypothetical protein
VVPTRAAITNASSILIRLCSARFVINLVSTANVDVIKRIQVTTFMNGPILSLEPGSRGSTWCEKTKGGSTVIASLVEVNHFKRRLNVRSDLWSMDIGRARPNRKAKRTVISANDKMAVRTLHDTASKRQMGAQQCKVPPVWPNNTSNVPIRPGQWVRHPAYRFPAAEIL